jgi:1-hydroxycarotenoid 3,4-desaturase
LKESWALRSDDRVIVIGAGIGGLACAIDLAAQGFAVSVVERAARAGGKMRESHVAGATIDAGPTVFTMRWVFDALFDAAGAALDDYVELTPLDVLARHAWSDGSRLDLFADIDRAADAVAAFSGPEEGIRFLAFCDEAAAIYRTLRDPFLASPRPGPLTLTRRIGIHRPAALFGMRPFETLWSALCKSFHDPRLRQLFGRYATYSGSSPFAAPATLMLIAHVERDGVWTVGGGMQRLAEALQRLAASLGVVFHFGAEASAVVVERHAAAGIVLSSGERLDADAVVVNADTAALVDGCLGAAVATAADPVARGDRSLSAVTWALVAEAEGFPLLRHSIFFCDDYAAEFDDLFKHSRLPAAPTVYVCAQDRGGRDGATLSGAERLLMLVNAPPTGDSHIFHPEEIAACENSVFRLLERCGLSLRRRAAAISITTPADFHRLFPATGGALYGRASHGWTASFRRPASHTRIPGLYLAGGSTHPGAGVPMAALSGRLAARRLLSDRGSMRTFHRVATSGGTSTA